jgi:hypothetical protein
MVPVNASLSSFSRSETCICPAVVLTLRLPWLLSCPLLAR